MSLTIAVTRADGVFDGAEIIGTIEELDDLRDTIADAIEHGEAEGQLLTDVGVAPLTVRAID